MYAIVKHADMWFVVEVPDKHKLLYRADTIEEAADALGLVEKLITQHPPNSRKPKRKTA